MNNQNKHSLSSNKLITHYGRGALYIKSFKVKVQGDVIFSHNSNSSVYLFFSILEVDSNSHLSFKNNVGYKGGAICLRGSASLHLHDNIFIVFDSNAAYNSGGAIFHEALNDPSYLSIRNCFLKYVDIQKNATKRNITVDFYQQHSY